ncbi:efflux RND transporter periplasmic adaptor subunit [Chryseolinea sp. T2]|uniref:efflux RND transporter periplasmic adaptor subunit n=1 Tax=Chryseolinea sp. T2 TaxID=3129255 RepID=UPI0030774CBD
MKVEFPGGIIPLLLIVVYLSGCSGDAKERTVEQQPFIPVTQIVAKDTVVDRVYVADINAYRKTEIRARIQGYIEQIYVDEGKEVKEGQLLFRINADEYMAQLREEKATLASAEAEARTAQLELGQVKLLVEKNVISNTELEVARAKRDAYSAKVEEAKSRVASAALKVEYTSIRSPFTGIIDRIPFKVGSLIDEGSLLTTVSDTRFVYAYYNVSESEYLDYMQKKLEQTNEDSDDATLILADGSEHPQTGKIETMDGEFENTTGTIAFRALFPNPDKILKHGASGKVKLMTTLKDAIIVPQKATFEIQDKTYVYVVDEQNQLRMQSITPKLRFSHFYIVEEGVESGDKVVYEGLQNVKEGMKISPTAVLMDSLMLVAQDIGSIDI